MNFVKAMQIVSEGGAVTRKEYAAKDENNLEFFGLDSGGLCYCSAGIVRDTETWCTVTTHPGFSIDDFLATDWLKVKLPPQLETRFGNRKEVTNG